MLWLMFPFWGSEGKLSLRKTVLDLRQVLLMYYVEPMSVKIFRIVKYKISRHLAYN